MSLIFHCCFPHALLLLVWFVFSISHRLLYFLYCSNLKDVLIVWCLLMMKKLHLSIWGYGADKKMTGEILQIKLSVQKLLMNIKELWKGLLPSMVSDYFKPVLQSRLASEEHHRGNQEVGNKGKGGDSRVKFHEPIAFFSGTSFQNPRKTMKIRHIWEYRIGTSSPL